jgi:hypothetical protein
MREKRGKQMNAGEKRKANEVVKRKKELSEEWG